MSVWAILACRSNSTRLYCKPLQNLDDRSILEHLITNIRTFKRVKGIALAIADGVSNNCFVEFAETHNLPFVIGSELNILSRVLQVVEKFGVTTMFRVTTECPFIYANDADKVIQSHVEDGYDFTTFHSLPLGMNYELINTQILFEMASTANPRYQGALSLYIKENQERFKTRLLSPLESCQRPELNLAVDHPAQLLFAQGVVRSFRGMSLPFPVEKIIKYADDNPIMLSLLNSIGEDVYTVRPDQTMARVWA